VKISKCENVKMADDENLLQHVFANAIVIPLRLCAFVATGFSHEGTATQRE
jgi:hypothetical protein